jgi:putative ABC transport system permease protein
MFRHHLLLTFRNFKRYKGSFFINLFGLSAGLTCALLIYIWVSDEYLVDKFHQHSDRLYQVLVSETKENEIIVGDATPGLLGDALEKEVPGVAKAVSLSNWLGNSKLSVGNHMLVKANGKYAGKDFFNVFTYPFIAGNANQALTNKNSIVISASMAKKLFGTTDVVGKQLNWMHSSISTDSHAMISGVFQDVPLSSSDRFDYVVPLAVLMEVSPPAREWFNFGQNTYVMLEKGTDIKAFESNIRNFLAKKGVKNIALVTRLYRDAYLYGTYENGKQVGGRIDYVQLFSLIAIFILLIACVNFINLSTAKASRRLKEVGIKKVLGANRNLLIMQYLGESLILTFLSLFIALLAVELLMPQFNQITDKQLALHFDARLILSLLLITSFTGLISGSYPALYLSGLNPAAALKGRLSKTVGELWTRRSLVIFQFSLSVVLIVSVIVIYKQIEYVQNKNLGFKKKNIVSVQAEGKLRENTNAFIQEVKKLPGIVNAGAFRGSLLGGGLTTPWSGHNPEREVPFRAGGMSIGLIETMGMQMAEGRSFSSRFGADSSKIILNEAGVKAIGFKQPIGKTFRMWERDYEIIGVVKNFHFESMHQEVRPMFFRLEGENNSRVMIRIKEGEERRAIAALTALYDKFNPGYNFEYQFLDQDFQAQYVAENRVAVLSKYFAGLAIVISCLGLFGLAAFTAERRLREIGIRKILGASEMSVMLILSKDFLKPVLIAILIALPVSYLLTSHWLNSFVYRIDLKLWYFAAAGFLAMIISWLTVSMQAIRAATVNPIQCIKAE